MAQFVHRSAILGKIQLHNHSVDDLNLALRCGYPKNLRFKAYQRLAVAHSSLGDKEKAIEAYKKLFKSLNEADLPIERIKKMKSDCIESVKTLQSSQSSRPIRGQYTGHEITLDQSESSIHEKIEVKVTETRGRYAVARVPISAGEVIVSDSACLVSVAPGMRESHCYTCGQETISPLPSHVSCHVSFCSPKCRQVSIFCQKFNKKYDFTKWKIAEQSGCCC